jgi:hypothetical protein
MRKGVPWHQIARGLSIENLDHETENQGKDLLEARRGVCRKPIKA